MRKEGRGKRGKSGLCDWMPERLEAMEGERG